MAVYHDEREDAEDKFKLLSAVSLIRKINDNTATDAIYNEAERKFYTLIGILDDSYPQESIPESVEYSKDDLKKGALSVLDCLVSNSKSDPYVTLCSLKDAPIEEIKRRRNKLLNIYHPDRYKKTFADEVKTREINEAYKKILNQYSEKVLNYSNKAVNIPHTDSYRGYQFGRKQIFFLILTAILLIFSAIMAVIFIFNIR